MLQETWKQCLEARTNERKATKDEEKLYPMKWRITDPLCQAQSCSSFLHQKATLGGMLVLSKIGSWVTLMEGDWWRVENQSDSDESILLYSNNKTLKQDIYSCIHHQKNYHVNGGKDKLNLTRNTLVLETQIYLWAYNIFIIVKVKYIFIFPRKNKLNMFGLWWKTLLLHLQWKRWERETLNTIFDILYATKM